MTVTGTTTALDDDRAAVRVEDVFDTTIDDLWEACTRPDRLARWIAEVTGELHEGGTAHVVFTSTWTGPVRIDVCEAPHHLLLTLEPGGEEETRLEAWLTPEGEATRLVVEERGLPLAQVHFYGAGWQVHLEDLGRSLATDAPVHPGGWSAEAPSSAWKARWDVLTPAYEERSATQG